MKLFSRKYLPCILALFALSAIWSSGQTNATPVATTINGGNDPFRAGGLSFNFPSPGKDLFEAGRDYRVVLEPLAPDSNRLIAAFVQSDVLDIQHTGTFPQLEEYAFIEVPRRAEFVDIDEDSFNQVSGTVGKAFSADLSGSIKDSQQQLDQRLKVLGSTASVTLDKPLPLGLLFSKTDAVAYGMVMPVTTKGGTIQIAMAMGVMRVHNRVLFAYFFTRFKDQGTVARLRTTEEQWTDAILSANR